MESQHAVEWFCEHCENNHEIYEEPEFVQTSSEEAKPTDSTHCQHSEEKVCEHCLEKVEITTEKKAQPLRIRCGEKDPRPKGQSLSDKKFYLFMDFALLAASAYALWHGTKFHLSAINDSANSIIKTLSRPTLMF